MMKKKSGEDEGIQKKKKKEKSQEGIVELEFVEGDCFGVSWEQNADIAFVPSTCFTEEMMQQLAEKVQHMKQGARVITQTVPLNAPGFKLIHKRRYKYGARRGTTTVFIFEKKKQNK